MFIHLPSPSGYFQINEQQALSVPQGDASGFHLSRLGSYKKTGSTLDHNREEFIPSSDAAFLRELNVCSTQ